MLWYSTLEEEFISRPLGNSGKNFVQELNRLIRVYVEQCALESVALQAVTVRPLQFTLQFQIFPAFED